jgi:hypothetical protein
MNLNEFVATHKRGILDDLLNLKEPSIGVWDSDSLGKCRALNTAPKIGTAVYFQDRVELEFIYMADGQATEVLTVSVPAPERIVFLPVPKWVVETIWQGEISGTFHFESDALRLVAQFQASLEPRENEALFGPARPTRRE